MTATSSQRLNLRPTSRSTPTSSKPHASCSARDAVPLGFDPGDDRMETGIGGDADHVLHQPAPDAETRVLARHVHRVLHGGAVRRAFLVGRQRCEADDLVVDRRDDRGEGPRPLGDPTSLFVQRPRHQVEGAGVIADLDVVDRQDRRRVIERGEAHDDAPGRPVPTVPAGPGGCVDTSVESSGTHRESRGGCPAAAGTLLPLVAALPCPEGCPGYRYKRCSHPSRTPS